MAKAIDRPPSVPASLLVLGSVVSVQIGQAFGKQLFASVSGTAMASYLLLSQRAGGASKDGSMLALAVAWAALLTLPFGIHDSGTALLAPKLLLAGLASAGAIAFHK